jgi:hypothetical protein
VPLVSYNWLRRYVHLLYISLRLLEQVQVTRVFRGHVLNGGIEHRCLSQVGIQRKGWQLLE